MNVCRNRKEAIKSEAAKRCFPRDKSLGSAQGLPTRIATSILKLSTIYRRIPVQEGAKSKHGLRRPTHCTTERARTSNTHSTTSTSRCDNDLHPTNQPHHHALPPSPDNDSQRRRILLHQTHPQRPPRPLFILPNATLPHPHPAPRLRRCKKSRRQTHFVQKREKDNHPQRCVLQMAHHLRVGWEAEEHTTSYGRAEEEG